MCAKREFTDVGANHCCHYLVAEMLITVVRCVYVFSERHSSAAIFAVGDFDCREASAACGVLAFRS